MIQGSIITIDAMGCQKSIIEQIKSQDSEYVIVLKSNQENLPAEIDFFSNRQKKCHKRNQIAILLK